MNKFLFNLIVTLLVALVFFGILYSGLQQVMGPVSHSGKTFGESLDSWLIDQIFSKRTLGILLLAGLGLWVYKEFKKD